ncbi:MAG: response regulator, partial [bacterium]
IVACFVEQLGYSATSAADPEEALEEAARHPYDVVITDALMPKLDGRELCRRLKAMPKGASRKVILMSSLYKSRRARLEAFAFGIDEFLPKPLNFGELAAVLGRIAPIVPEMAAIRTAV